ncbi:MAG: GspH/FimT family pseudopilin [Burkholderiaceae bacterium]
MQLIRRHPGSFPQGLTLIELLITVSILGIALALGLPSLADAMAQQRVRTGAEGVMAGLNLARTEAVRRNTNVSFTLENNAGWSVTVDDGDPDVADVVVQRRPGYETGRNINVVATDDNSVLTFTPLGAVSNFADAATLTEITVGPADSATADTLQINISAGGQIRLCNQTIQAADDPRRC